MFIHSENIYIIQFHFRSDIYEENKIFTNLISDFSKNVQINVPN
jgi:hypothetical protein